MKKIHYAWIVLFLSFIALLSAQGVRLSFGAFVSPWEIDFSTSRAIVSLIAFVSYLVYGLSQPYIGRLIDTYGVRMILSFSILLIGVTTILTYFATNPWQLIIIYGVISSIGFGGASNVAGSIIVANWFSEKRGFALGLMSAGTAVGQLLLVPFSLYLISHFGWKNTVLILGFFLVFVIFPIIFFFIRNFPADKGIEAYGNIETHQKKLATKEETPSTTPKHLSIIQLLKNKAFLFLLLPFFVCGVTTSGLMDTHLIPFAQVCGFSPAVTGTAVSLLAGFNIAGTIFSGYLADRLNPKYILTILYGSRALTIVLLILISSDQHLFQFAITQSHLLIIFAITFGIVDFATVAPTIKLATTYFKHLSVGGVIGWLFLSHQVGSALGAYIPGVLFDLTGGYNISFVLSICLLVVASIFSYLLPNVVTTKD
ncbi:MFS transporter [Bacillus sp. 31A1R]|uniref:MFS transporter n=1 Tax=Robertmurraya mangrovi TaxID=3098077 RepID=A0ABU5J023_9BACI|nr:MFS transporter [Bacillus sp. 31A1R]MDZ5472763.1 MFS transporter [Bacillus sp. 31A1R]